MEIRMAAQPVVAVDLPVAEVGRQRRQQAAVAVALIPGGQHDRVVVLRDRALMVQVAQRQAQAVLARLHAGHLVAPQEAVARLAADALAVEDLEDLLDQRQVRCRVVGVPVLVEQLLALAAGAAEDEVGEVGVEDLVDEGAVVRRLDRARPHHQVHLRPLRPAVQVHEDLRRALARADDGDAPRLAVAGDGLQVVAGVEDPRIVLEGLELGRHPRHAADAHHQVAGQALAHRAGRVARAHPQQPDLAGTRLGQHLEDILAIGAAVLELGRGPGEVVVELVAAGEEGLQVDEVLQPVLLMQVVQEGEAAGRVAQRRQVLQEGDLHVRLVQQHVLVPDETGLALHEQRVQRPVLRAALAAFLQRDGQGDVGRAEADADQVMEVHGCLRIGELRGRARRTRPRRRRAGSRARRRRSARASAGPAPRACAGTGSP